MDKCTIIWHQQIWDQMFHTQMMQCFQDSVVDIHGMYCAEMVIWLWWRLCDVCCDLQFLWKRERDRRKTKAYWESDECQMNLTNQPKLPVLPFTDQLSFLSLSKTADDTRIACAAIWLRKEVQAKAPGLFGSTLWIRFFIAHLHQDREHTNHHYMLIKTKTRKNIAASSEYQGSYALRHLSTYKKKNYILFFKPVTI